MKARTRIVTTSTTRESTKYKNLRTASSTNMNNPSKTDSVVKAPQRTLLPAWASNQEDTLRYIRIYYLQLSSLSNHKSSRSINGIIIQA